jgi:hypothetical protein
MTDFFHRLAANLAASDLLRLYFLDLDGHPIAATMCIDTDPPPTCTTTAMTPPTRP